MSVSPELQETVGNYTIERSLAHGSMGHVYVARHSLTHAHVALKVLRADLTADTQVEERFLREVRAAAHIGHDGIVKVYDAGRSQDGRLYLAMELLSGETLEERMERHAGDRLDAMDWLLRVLEPLAAAHVQGIVHRDLKPANVFIARTADGSEHMKLLDFGLARDTREKSGTETGIAMGTPYYMSPEQATRPKHVGPASDIWSLGVMMYEVLSGHMPFEGETLHAIVIQSSTEAHAPLAEREPLLDARLCELVDDCLCKDQAERPADALALEVRLRPLLEDPHVREQLGQSASDEPATTEQEQTTALRLSAMPFADTAISLSPRLLESDVRMAPRRSTRGWWISALTALALATLGFFWALGRADDKPSSVEVRRVPPAVVTPADAPNQAPERTAHAEPEPVKTPALPENRPGHASASERSESAANPHNNTATITNPLLGIGDPQPPLAAAPDDNPPAATAPATPPPSAAEPVTTPDLSTIGQAPVADPPEETAPAPSDLPPPDPPEPSPP